MFGLKRKEVMRAAPRARPGPRLRTAPPERPKLSGVTYAIGDVHGRLDLFDSILAMIKDDALTFGRNEPPTVVLLGDLIDRGPDSASCVERALRLSDEGWCEVQALKGNHEEALLLFLEDPEIGRQWFQHGGATTLQSYGVDLTGVGLGGGWAGVQARLLEVLPPSHRTFLNSLKLYYERDDYIFVHAGVRPGRPLDQQVEADLLWIRDAFLKVETPFPGKVVVHGHTPATGPEIRSGRINVDTGAYASGVLTAVRLRGFERTILQAR